MFGCVTSFSSLTWVDALIILGIVWVWVYCTYVWVFWGLMPDDGWGKSDKEIAGI